MSIKLTQPQVMLHQMVTDFADKEVKPFDMWIDKHREYPAGLWSNIVNTGFLGFHQLNLKGVLM